MRLVSLYLLAALCAVCYADFQPTQVWVAILQNVTSAQTYEYLPLTTGLTSGDYLVEPPASVVAFGGVPQGWVVAPDSSGEAAGTATVSDGSMTVGSVSYSIDDEGNWSCKCDNGDGTYCTTFSSSYSTPDGTVSTRTSSATSIDWGRGDDFVACVFLMNSVPRIAESKQNKGKDREPIKHFVESQHDSALFRPDMRRRDVGPYFNMFMNIQWNVTETGDLIQDGGDSSPVDGSWIYTPSATIPHYTSEPGFVSPGFGLACNTTGWAFGNATYIASNTTTGAYTFVYMEGVSIDGGSEYLGGIDTDDFLIAENFLVEFTPDTVLYTVVFSGAKFQPPPPIPRTIFSGTFPYEPSSESK